MHPRSDKTRKTNSGENSNHVEDQTAGLRRLDGGRLTEELQALPGKSTQELKQVWQTLLGTQPPSKLSRDLLIRVIADRLQEVELGGLAPAVKRRLAALARGTENGAKTGPAHPMLRLKPGTKLVRAWRGETHIVLVLENGFEHQGKRYTSLTQIADEVTGAHWSGPRFFGLIKPRPTTPSSEARNGA
jgi:Protein of unknown function (DUF2924)